MSTEMMSVNLTWLLKPGMLDHSDSSDDLMSSRTTVREKGEGVPQALILQAEKFDLTARYLSNLAILIEHSPGYDKELWSLSQEIDDDIPRTVLTGPRDKVLKLLQLGIVVTNEQYDKYPSEGWDVYPGKPKDEVEEQKILHGILWLK